MHILAYSGRTEAIDFILEGCEEPLEYIRQTFSKVNQDGKTIFHVAHDAWTVDYLLTTLKRIEELNMHWLIEAILQARDNYVGFTALHYWTAKGKLKFLS